MISVPDANMNREIEQMEETAPRNYIVSTGEHEFYSFYPKIDSVTGKVPQPNSGLGRAFLTSEGLSFDLNLHLNAFKEKIKETEGKEWPLINLAVEYGAKGVRYIGNE